MPTYIQKTTNSDLTPSWPNTSLFDKVMSTGTGSDTGFAMNEMAGQTRSAAFITPASIPDNDAWEDAGTHTVELEIDVQNANIDVRCRIVRLSSTGTILERGAFTNFQTLGAASRSFAPDSPTWSSAEDCDNRIAIEFEFVFNGMGNEAATIGLGTTSNEVITDISETAGGCGSQAFERTASQSITHSSVVVREGSTFNRTGITVLVHSSVVVRVGSTFNRIATTILTHIDSIVRILTFNRTAAQNLLHSSVVSRAGSTFNRIGTTILTHIDNAIRQGSTFLRTAVDALIHSDAAVSLHIPGGAPSGGAFGHQAAFKPRLKQKSKIINLAVGTFGVRFRHFSTSRIKATTRNLANARLSSQVAVGQAKGTIKTRIANLAIRKRLVEINHLATSKLTQHTEVFFNSRIKTRVTEAAHGTLSTRRKKKKKLKAILDKLENNDNLDVV